MEHSDALKRCPSCSKYLPRSEFTRKKASKDGLECYCKHCRREYRLASQRIHPAQFKRHHLSVNQYKALLAYQGDGCGLCGTDTPDEGKANFNIDHDHSCCASDPLGTSRSCGACIRGLLCRNCNFLLGFAKDSRQILQSAIDYLT